jgi:large subunit ribosomal protein L23
MLPYITEKSLRLTKAGVYTFLVPKDTEKIAFSQTIEKFYHVTVTKVKSLVKQSAMRRMGRRIGKTAKMKKILITLKKGQKIPGFEVAQEEKKDKAEKS